MKPLIYAFFRRFPADFYSGSKVNHLVQTSHILRPLDEIYTLVQSVP